LRPVMSLRESCMRENRTCRLSGGRWLARKRATSDPTLMKSAKADGAKGLRHPALDMDQPHNGRSL
jgi:hypothetical protein